MISAQDLRIGNYIDYCGNMMRVWSIYSPTPREEKSFDGKYLLEINAPDSFLVAIDECEPIPLTEEILYKLGFGKEKVYGQDICYCGNASFLIDYVSIRIYPSSEKYFLVEANLEKTKQASCTRVTYLHELQNLLKVLTSEELNIDKLKAV